MCSIIKKKEKEKRKWLIVNRGKNRKKEIIRGFLGAFLIFYLTESEWLCTDIQWL